MVLLWARVIETEPTNKSFVNNLLHVSRRFATAEPRQDGSSFEVVFVCVAFVIEFNRVVAEKG